MYVCVCVSVHPSVCGRVGVDGLQVSFLPNVKLSGNTESAFLSPSQDSNVNFQPYSSGLLLETPRLTFPNILLENQNLAAESWIVSLQLPKHFQAVEESGAWS